MLTNAISRVALAAALTGGLVMATTSVATAYVACNGSDCWHSDDRVKIPHAKITFHEDSWHDQHANDKHYTWHEADADHDAGKGYWDHGSWHAR